MPKCVKIWKNLGNFWRSSNFQGGSEFTRASEGPQNVGKMTGMDVLEFRDINGLDISVNIHRRDKFLHSNLLQFEFLSQ